jgi:hypothetical protein
LDLEAFEVAQLIGHMQRPTAAEAVEPPVAPSKSWWRFGPNKSGE